MRIVDFADGAQSETTPVIGNIKASALIEYPDDATYEATEQGAPQEGNLYFNTTIKQIRYYNGTAWITLVDESTAQTLSNKSIDADSNTITNIDNDEIKAGAAIDVTKLHDGSVDNTEFSHLDGVSSNIQTQLDAKQETSEKDQPNGYAGLDGDGRISESALPVTALIYRGVWDASTNTPTLADGTGTQGDVYRTSVAGTQDLGSGSQSFDVGDWVTYNGSVWQRSDFAGAGVLNDLADVDAPAPADGQVLIYNSTDSEWQPGTIQTTVQENIALIGKGTGTWTAGSGTSNVSVAESLTNTDDFAFTAAAEAGYTFTPSQTGPLQFAVGKFIDNGLANGDGIVQAKLYATSGGLPTGAAIATSNSFGTGSIPLSTEFDNNFIFASNPVLTAGTEYAIVYDITDTGTLFSRRGNVNETFSANVSENGSPPPDWELNPVQETLYFQVFVEVANTNSLVLSDDVFISIPGLEDSYHTIQAQTINIGDGQAAHVTIDRAASSTTNLTVTVEDLTSVTNDNNKIVFLRASGGEGYFGIHDPQKFEDGDVTELQKSAADPFVPVNQLVESASTGLEVYPGAADVYTDITSIDLTEGTWDIFFHATFFSNGVTSTNEIFVGMGTVAGAVSPGPLGQSLVFTSKRTASGDADPVTGFQMGEVVVGPGTTTYYLKSFAETSVTNLNVTYKVSARRVV